MVKDLKISLDKAPLGVITKVKGNIIREAVQQLAFMVRKRSGL